MEFDVGVFKGTDLYQNLTQSQKEYTIKVLDDVQSYKAISKSKLEISKEFGDRFRTGGEWDVKKKAMMSEKELFQTNIWTTLCMDWLALS